MLMTFYLDKTLETNQTTFEQLLFASDLTQPMKFTKAFKKITTEVTNDFAESKLGRTPKLWQNMPTNIALETPEIKYNTFYIPKKSDPTKKRRIDEPNPELKIYLRNLKMTFEDIYMFQAHDCAHAYVPERSAVTAMQVHQNNESRWFLKLDVKDFFPNHDKNFIMKQMRKVYPFGAMMKLPSSEEAIETWVKSALYRNKLPQGTPLSPLLTNITMLPIDHDIYQKLKGERNHYIYTRYADDLLISCKVKFDPDYIVRIIKQILKNHEAPFQLNETKTRFGSSNGRNWNMGIMLNKDNNLTIGHRSNQKLRAALFSFFKDNLTEENPWSIMKTQQFQGLIAWYKAIQPETTEHYIRKYETKFQANFTELCKRLLNS